MEKEGSGRRKKQEAEGRKWKDKRKEGRKKRRGKGGREETVLWTRTAAKRRTASLVTSNSPPKH
jgi:hypothetical protein